MKNFLLTLGAGLLGLSGMSAADYVVYNNGQVGAGLKVNSWWNDTFNLTADNPDGEGKVLEFKANGAQGYGNASMGFAMESADYNTGKLHNATLNFDWYAEGTGTYAVKLTSVVEKEVNIFTVNAENAGKWNTVSINVAETYPEVAADWNNNKNEGKGNVFSLCLSNGTEGDVVYVKNVYYSNVDESWVAPEVEEVAPETVPTPTLAAADVMSIFSSGYTPVTTFNIGYWGQTTSSKLMTIGAQEVYQLKNFNYLGWELNQHIDISECDYMHVDFWTAEETSFGFTPISPNQEKAYIASDIVLNEWNSFDVPLKYWDNVDMSDIYQIKFDQGQTVECYLANVYFYKSENGGGEDNPGESGSHTGSTTATLTNCYLIGTPDTERIDLEVTLDYNIVYNEDKTLTITIVPQTEQFEQVTGMVPQLFIEHAYAGNFSDSTPRTFTTTTTYEIGDKVNMNLYCAYAGGAATFPDINYTVDKNTRIESVAGAETVDVYNINGVRVAKNIDFESVKSQLAPGLYIVGGKKVVVK